MDTKAKERKMRKTFNKLKKKITELNKDLLTIADGSYSILKPNTNEGEILLSWKTKRPELLCKNVLQVDDDCWSHAYSRGIHAMMKKLGYTGVIPTAEQLVAEIDSKLLTKTKSITKANAPADLLYNKYGVKMVIHHRPRPELVDANEAFDIFIERLLAVAPVAVCFPYLPSYDLFPHEKKEVFCPSPTDIIAMQCETLEGHCAVVSGRGVVMKNGISTEFWEIHETLGADIGDNGFTRFQRRRGLITKVFEFKLRH